MAPVTFAKEEWAERPCDTYGGRPANGLEIYIYFLPKEGRWSLRDQHDIFLSCQVTPEVADVFPNTNMEGGFSFPSEYGPDGAADLRTYGLSSSSSIFDDWRSVLLRPDVDARTEIDGRCDRYDHCICLCAKWGVPLRKVATIIHLLARNGHHIVRTQGFEMDSAFERVIRVGSSVRKSYIHRAEMRKMQKEWRIIPGK